jgi:hypothetical protein
VRTIVKASGAAITQAAVTEENDAGWGLLAGLAGRIFTEGTEAADTRGSRYFPRYAFVGGINLSPGEHTVTLNFYSGGRVIATVSKTVQARENRLNLVEAVCLK